MNDVVNGEGVCVSVWFAGCPHRCKGCHNESTWDKDSGKPFTQYHIDTIKENLIARGINRNLSVLGGEPLAPYNIDNCLDLLRQVKEEYPKITVYLWTGYVYETLLKDSKALEVLKLVDILIDGPFVESQKDLMLKLRGSSNQRILNLKKDSYELLDNK